MRLANKCCCATDAVCVSPQVGTPKRLGGLWIAFVAQRPQEARATNLQAAQHHVWDKDRRATRDE